MSDEVFDGLDGVGVGEKELIDPREGDHIATITDVGLANNSPTAQTKHAVLVTFGGMTDTDGREFEQDDRINIPTSDSEPKIQGMFLGSLHRYGFVSWEDRRPRFADTDEQVESVLVAFRGLIGKKVPINFAIKKGWPRISLRNST